jgi:SagB-type dehydrogenase family enzyme
MARRFAFLCSSLNDPRQIRLRDSDILRAYEQRGAFDDVVEISHDLTNLRRCDTSRLVEGVQLFEQPFMQAVQFTHERQYPLSPSVALAKPTLPDASFREVLCTRRSSRSFGDHPVTLTALGSLLFAAIGETGQVTSGRPDDHSVCASLRTIPSGGALQPTCIFLGLIKSDELDTGIYHYDVTEHSLDFVKAFDERGLQSLFAAFPIHPDGVDLARASAIFFISTRFWRSRAKYGARGYRYALLEAGCACQNLGLAAASLGLAHVVLGGYYDDEIHRCLGIDGVEQAVIAAVAVATRSKNKNEEASDV